MNDDALTGILYVGDLHSRERREVRAWLGELGWVGADIGGLIHIDEVEISFSSIAYGDLDDAVYATPVTLPRGGEPIPPAIAARLIR